MSQTQDNLITMYSKESDEFIMTRFTKRRFTQKDFKLKLKKYSKKLRKYVEFVGTKRPYKKK